MLMVASTTIIYEVGIYIINIIKLNASIELALFLKILAIETIYNTIITIIAILTVFQLVRDIFKEKK